MDRSQGLSHAKIKVQTETGQEMKKWILLLISPAALEIHLLLDFVSLNYTHKHTPTHTDIHERP